MKFEKCDRESLRFVANTKYWSFCSFLLMFFRTVFLKFSHVSDDGSEIDSKYNIHITFVIVL